MNLLTALKNVFPFLPEGEAKEVIEDYMASKEETPSAGKAYAYSIVLEDGKVIRSDEPFPTKYACNKAMAHKACLCAVHYPELKIVSIDVFNIYERIAELEKKGLKK